MSETYREVPGRTVVVNDFPGHKGRPGERGGSAPKGSMSVPVTEKAAEQAFHDKLAELWRNGNLTFYHEAPGDVSKSMLKDGIKSDYGVFASVNQPSNFVSSDIKTEVRFQIPYLALDKVGHDMAYGSDKVEPYQDLIGKHPDNLKGAYVSYAPSITPYYIDRVAVLKKQPDGSYQEIWSKSKPKSNAAQIYTNTPTPVDSNTVALVALFQLDHGKWKTLLQFDPEHENWKMIGGHVHEGETLDAAAYRETWEETGFGLGEQQLVYVLSVPKEQSHGGKTTVVLYYVVIPEGLAGRQESVEGKVQWFPVDDIPELAYNSGWLVDKARSCLEPKANAFPGHKGRPGFKGGSVAQDVQGPQLERQAAKCLGDGLDWRT